ncbi:MAG: hypothetical protein AAF432_16425 [Planctomycetota bacterium]
MKMINRHLMLPAVAAALVTGMAHAQTTTAPTTAPEAESETKVELPDLTEIITTLEELRGLNFVKEVPAEQQSLDDFDAYIVKSIDEMFPEDVRTNLSDGLLTLGMITEPLDLGEAFRQALLTQAGAYYDPAQGTFFYLMVDMPMMALQTIAAHELTHALQDQHFDLNKYLEDVMAMTMDDIRQDDAILAARSLVEGEATYIHTLFQFKQMGMDIEQGMPMVRTAMKMQAEMDLDELVKMSQQMMEQQFGKLDDDNDLAKSIEAMDEIPDYIIKPLIGAYMIGANFVMEVHDAKGWGGVNSIYEARPASMEQVLHPQKYGTDLPTPVVLPDLQALDGWQKIDAAVHGEFFMMTWLENLGVRRSVAKKAAAGWDGDTYAAFRSPDGDVIAVLATTWDSEKQAKEFAKAACEGLFGTDDRKLLNKAIDMASGGFVHQANMTIEGPAGVKKSREAFGINGKNVFVIRGGNAGLHDALFDELLDLEIVTVP